MSDDTEFAACQDIRDDISSSIVHFPVAPEPAGDNKTPSPDNIILYNNIGFSRSSTIMIMVNYLECLYYGDSALRARCCKLFIILVILLLSSELNIYKYTGREQFSQDMWVMLGTLNKLILNKGRDTNY